MSNQKQEYLNLIKDSLCFLKEEKDLSIFASQEEFASLQQEIEKIPKQKIETPISRQPSKPTPRVNNYTKPIANKKTEKIKFAEKIPTKQKQETNNSVFLEPPKKEFSSLSFLQSLLEKMAPDIDYIEKIPDDKKAKEIANSWKYKSQIAPITILSLHHNRLYVMFLKQITKAIDIYFHPSRIVNAILLEKENRWDTFLENSEIKIFIASEMDLKKHPHLMKHFSKDGKKYFLKGKPLFLLPDLNLYLRDHTLKRNLWEALLEFMNEQDFKK